MDINDILNSLGLDLTNPEARRGAIEAIEAILSSRAPTGSISGNMGGGEEDVEIDPDLLQPSQKHSPQGSMDDIEIEDEEHILDQVKQNESDDDESNDISGSNSSQSASSDESSSTDSETNDTADGSDENTAEDSADGSESDATSTDNTDKATSAEKSETSSAGNETEEDNSEEGEADADENGSEVGTDGEDSEEVTGDDGDDENESAGGDDSLDAGGENVDTETAEEEDEDDEDKDEYDPDFEDDLLDDELKDIYDDEEIKSKHDARKIKRERTLQAAKKALTDAQAKKVAPALIRELEKSIAALEELNEAVAKNLKDISDEEFNLLINRVLDAIDAVGDSGLTYKSDEERKLQAQEIKADLESSSTQAELSAEDVAQIRAETQAIKAKEKEVDKYKMRAASSFKGFQDFLNSLYRAVALQVSSEETKDDTWSAISRRNSGAGVLRQGQKINELPNRKIPVIDFYFDCSSSWTANDIAIGQKAVSALADMEADGKIKINIYYFGDEVSNVYEDVAGGGTSGWNEIVKNIIATRATNVIIMTDSDMESWWTGEKALTYKVPGYVWYLWKRGINAPRLPRDLNGRGGTQQFSFNPSDL
jgi:hypothetical protein